MKINSNSETNIVCHISALGFNTAPSALRSKDRRENTSKARLAAVYLYRKLFNTSYKELSSLFHRDMHTIDILYQKAAKMYITDKDFASKIDAMQNMILCTEKDSLINNDYK